MSMTFLASSINEGRKNHAKSDTGVTEPYSGEVITPSPDKISSAIYTEQPFRPALMSPK